MPSGQPATTTLALLPADPSASAVTSPAPPASLVVNWDTLVDRGPRAVADAVGRLAGDAAGTLMWLVAVVVAAVLIRIFAQRAIAALTARIADVDRDSRARRLIRRARDRTRGRASSLPLLTASLVTLAERRRQRARAIGSLASSVVSGLLVVGVILLIAARAGVPGGTLASVGVLGLVGAVLAQGLAKDILAGAFVLMEDTYGVGDYIDVTLGSAGVVEQIGLRTTRLRGPDGTVWHVRHSEMIRIGNRTQEQSLLQLDVTVGFPQLLFPEPGQARAVGVAELARAERLIRMSLDRLDRDLLAARHAGDGPSAPALPSTLAVLVPELVADVSHAALTSLAKVDHAGVDTSPFPGMLEALLEDVDVPVLAETAVVGLSGADTTSVTLRVRGRVADTSREAALAVLRRRLFVDVTTDGLSVTFAAVDPATL